MSVSVPSNIIPWLLGAIVLIPLSLRAWVHSRKINTPTTRYFAITGLLGGIALAFYSFPPIVTSDPYWLKVGFIIGIPLLYIMLMYQSYYVWYAVLQKKISYYWLVIPTVLIGGAAIVNELRDTIRDDIKIVNNEVIFHFLPLSRVLQSTLLLLVLVNGLFFLKQATRLKERGAKLRFLSLGILYTLVAITTIADNLVFGGDSSSTPLLLGYAIGALAFFTTLVFVLVRKSPPTMAGATVESPDTPSPRPPENNN